MSKHLLLGTAQENWRLPSDVDVAELRQRLDEAARTDEVLSLIVEMNDNPLNRLTLSVNPRALAWWAVYEQPEPEPSSERVDALMAMIRWPLPYDHAPNDFEVVGRYIAQTIQMERFIDIILLHDGPNHATSSARSCRARSKTFGLLIERAAGALDEWHDLLDLMLSVARHRNGFAHRMFERGALPSHYGQGVPYEVLSDEELRQQETEAFQASEACRQLVERLTLASLSSDVHFGRHDSYWAQEGRGKNPPR